EDELKLYQANLEKSEIAELIDAPEMTNLQIRACMKLLMNMITPAYYTDQDVFTLISLKMVNLSIEHGNSKESAYGYCLWGSLAGVRLDDYEVGYEFGQLAMRLTEKFNDANLACKVFNIFGGLTSHWRSHLQKGIPILRKGYLAGVETADVHVGTNSYNLILQRIIAADNFSSILEESRKYLEYLRKIKNYAFAGMQQLYQHFVLNLQGLTAEKFSFNANGFDENECVQMWQENTFLSGVASYNIFKTQILFLYGDYEKALDRARESQNTLVFVSGISIQPEHYLYYSLTLTTLYPTAGFSEQQEYWEILENNRQKMKIWADNCPENLLHKYLLVEAEIARICSRDIEVIWDLYDRAISSAHENGYIQNEALGNELAAKFWLSKGKEEIAQLYMKKAHYGYQLWGAKRKVEDLEEKYPRLLPLSSAVSRMTSTRTTTRTTNNSTTTGSQSASALDLATVMKASVAISGEIVLDKLLTSLMKILIENAGAQVGYLILETSGKLLIEASGAVDGNNITVLQSIPIESSHSVSPTIINYVARTSESVVLNNATHEGNFTNDPYIKQHQPKSILCVPLLNQGKLISIVYLENNLTTGAFTPDRLEVLKVLSSSAAISIENARLYQTLEDKVSERTAQLAKANAEITALDEKLKAENLRMSAELEVTKQLQQMVLPKREELDSIEGLEIAGYMEPADEVGGDYYDVLPQDGKVKIGIGDVTGHGLESGVLMLMAQTAVRTLQESNQTDPVQFLDILNRTIYRNIQRINPYKNLTLVLLDYFDGTLSLSGQHEEIIVVRAGGLVERIDTTNLGFPIGLDEEIADFIASEQVQLNPGDVVVLYTDGITEAFDIDRKQYGIERLCEVVQRNCDCTAQEIRQVIIEDVRRHIGEQKLFDDITLVVLKQK
ncbi:MAG TPA: SpoIIE family protein phosphatase, partial [Coleofasciculaceae cyanobacterium]